MNVDDKMHMFIQSLQLRYKSVMIMENLDSLEEAMYGALHLDHVMT